MTMVTAIAGTASLAAAATASAETKGSGASFPRIAYQTWCQDSGGLCSYVSKGSTGGINDFIGGLVDFGATDAPLTPEQKANLASQRGGSGVLYFPTLLGAVTIPTNIPGQPDRIRLRARTVGRIFAGDITRWNDPQIKSDQTGYAPMKKFAFPNLPIVVCVRQDGSGTSFVASNFMSKASTEFKSRVGTANQLPAWTAPVLVKGQGNAGVATCVNQNSGSIGYVDLGDARAAGLGPRLAAVGKSEVIKVKRRVRGKLRTVTVRRLAFSPPSVAAIQRAAPKSIPADMVFDLTLSKEKAAYPIVATSYVLGYTNYAAAGKAASLAGVKATLNYFYSAGAQSKLSALGFAPLAPNMLAAAKAQLAKLK